MDIPTGHVFLVTDKDGSVLLNGQRATGGDGIVLPAAGLWKARWAPNSRSRLARGPSRSPASCALGSGTAGDEMRVVSPPPIRDRRRDLPSHGHVLGREWPMPGESVSSAIGSPILDR
jgi:hypothetical protein